MAILFVCRVSFWREGGLPSQTSKSTLFIYFSFGGPPRGGILVDVVLLPTVLAKGASIPFSRSLGCSGRGSGVGTLSHRKWEPAGSDDERHGDSSEILPGAWAGVELQRYRTWAVSQVWPSSLESNFLVPAHFLTLPVQLSCHLCDNWHLPDRASTC